MQFGPPATTKFIARVKIGGQEVDLKEDEKISPVLRVAEKYADDGYPSKVIRVQVSELVLDTPKEGE